MIKNKRLFYFVIIGVFLTSCLPKEKRSDQFIENLQIKSLKDTTNYSDAEAKMWDKEAYFVSCFITFGVNGKSSINTVYETPNQKHIAYSIWQYSDETLFTEHVLTDNVSRNNEVKRTDWVFDTKEVMQFAIEDQEITDFINSHSINLCGFMELEKSNVIQDKNSWRINLSECKNPQESIEIGVDPITGEILRE